MLELSLDELNTVKHILHTHIPDFEVWAFGSRIKQKAHEGSDLDLVIRNSKSLNSPCIKIDTIRTAFQDSNLPFLVDVIDWALIPASFQEEILKEYYSLQTAG